MGRQCKFWAQGHCSRGARCSFAHGPREEAREAPRRPGAQPAEELPGVLLPAEPGAAPACEALAGGAEGVRRVYQLGPELGRSGEIYVELQGEFTLRLAIPASTKISSEDRAAWDSVPVTLAGQSFGSLNALQAHVRSLLTESKPGTRLEGDDEALLLALFSYHPWAEEKLKDVSFVQVKRNQHDPKQNSFWLMRSEEEGDDISYVKCIRALAAAPREQAAAELDASRTETVEVLASVRLGVGLEVRLGPMRESLQKAPETVGLHVDLQACTAALRVSNWLGPLQLGPAPVRPARRRQKNEFPIFHIVDVPAGAHATVRFEPPFALPPPPAPEPDPAPEAEKAAEATPEQDEDEEVLFAGRCLQDLDLAD